VVRIKETGLTLASSAYEALRQDIIEGRVKPGEKLQFDALRNKYGIGISPIREALSRLQSEGWVAREEQRGYRVAEVSKSELLDVVKTRVMIEGIAVAEAIARQDVAAEEALVLAFHRLSKQHRLLEGGARNPEWEKRHRQFHMALIRGCGMQWIKQFCEQLFDVAERYRLMATASSPERRELDEHRAILQAYIGGEPDTVRSLLARHYQVTVDHILQSQSLPTPDRADTSLV
jgi:GntR family transcriptional regulator, carbon starvation induced regulator